MAQQYTVFTIEAAVITEVLHPLLTFNLVLYNALTIKLDYDTIIVMSLFIAICPCLLTFSSYISIPPLNPIEFHDDLSLAANIKIWMTGLSKRE